MSVYPVEEQYATQTEVIRFVREQARLWARSRWDETTAWLEVQGQVIRNASCGGGWVPEDEPEWTLVREIHRAAHALGQAERRFLDRDADRADRDAKLLAWLAEEN